MYKCPHCGEPGVSKMRKMFLGPAIPATCKACGKKVGVPYTAMLAALPFFIAIVASAFVESFLVKASLWIAGLLVLSVIHMLWIPLERR